MHQILIWAILSIGGIFLTLTILIVANKAWRETQAANSGYYPNNLVASCTTRSEVRPNFSYRTSIGAEAPKWSTPIACPRGPTYRSQPREVPASRETRTVT